MRCRSCQHELWNVRPGPCPECGEPFNPRTAVFERYSAHFCCPHCSEAYWGNGQDGLPDPPEFACARCAQPVRLEEMVLRPAPGQEGREIRQDLHPFDGSPKGFLRRCWATASMSVSDPGRMGRALGPTPRLGQAFLYLGAIVVAGISSGLLPMIAWIAHALITVGSIDVIGATSRDEVPIMMAAGAGLGVFAPMAVMALCMLVVWGILCLMGRAAGQGRRLVACTCYASGVVLIGVVPCIGICASPVVVAVGARTWLTQLRGAGILTERMTRWMYILLAVMFSVTIVATLWSVLS